MQSLNKDTLAYQLGLRPATRARTMGMAPVTEVVAQLNKFMKGKGPGDLTGSANVDVLMGESERDAVIFYLMNHAVSVVRQKVHPLESLGNYLPLVEEYQRQLSQRATRMFYYMLLICTRESRHCKSSYDSKTWQGLVHKYGQAVLDFHSTIKGIGSSSAADRFRDNPPNVLLGKYVEFLSDVFYEGTYSASYGGPAWGKVADVLRDYVLGKLTAEMMLDTSFTLAHNTGPIFNKGMLFEQQNNSELIRILDVQRSGQIPQMVANKETKWANDSQIQPLWKACEAALGDPMRGHVDWYMVEALGSVNTYPIDKKNQLAKHGMPADLQKKQDELVKKQLEDAKKKAELDAMMVTIMPGVKIKKVEVR